MSEGISVNIIKEFSRLRPDNEADSPESISQLASTNLIVDFLTSLNCKPRRQLRIVALQIMLHSRMKITPKVLLKKKNYRNKNFYNNFTSSGD